MATFDCSKDPEMSIIGSKPGPNPGWTTYIMKNGRELDFQPNQIPAECNPEDQSWDWKWELASPAVV
jgi:hypothetical protein